MEVRVKAVFRDLKDIYIEGDTIVFETEQGSVRARFNDVEEIMVPGVVIGPPTYPKLATIRFLLQWR